MARKTDSVLLPSPKQALILELLKSSITAPFGLELVEKSDGRLKRGTVYITLQRMEEDGLVESEQERRPDPEIGIPRRRYRITGLGERALYVYGAAQRAFTHPLVNAEV